MTRRQMLTALFGAAVLALPVAGRGAQPAPDEASAGPAPAISRCRTSRGQS